MSDEVPEWRSEYQGKPVPHPESACATSRDPFAFHGEDGCEAGERDAAGRYRRCKCRKFAEVTP